MVNESTPLAMMTLGQLKEFLNENVQQVPRSQSNRQYVYGLDGICKLFGVGTNTAQKYKKGILKDAVMQHGRKIIVDVEKAMALYKAAKSKD